MQNVRACPAGLPGGLEEGVALVPGEVLALPRGVVELKRGSRQVFHLGVGKARRGRAARRILAVRAAIVKQNRQ